MKIFLSAIMFSSILCVNAKDIIPKQPDSADVLSVLGYSYWKYEIKNPDKKNTINYEILYYFRDKDGIWIKKRLRSSSYTSLIKEENVMITFGLYQKDNDITVKTQGSVSKLNTQEFNIDLRDLDVSMHIEDININDEIVLKVRSKDSNVLSSDRNSWDKYLALKLTIKDV